MTKATPKSTKQSAGTALKTILGGPPPRPYPGVRSIPAKAIHRAVRKLFRERAAEERAATSKT
jgi:hypothetical protein